MLLTRVITITLLLAGTCAILTVYKPGDCKVGKIREDLEEKISKQTRLPLDFIPEDDEHELIIEYGNYSLCTTFLDGFGIYARVAESKPTTIKWTFDPNKFYLFIILDVWGEAGDGTLLFNWLVGNIPGDDISKGETLIGYNTEYGEIYKFNNLERWAHPHLFLLYEQPEKLTFNETLIDEGPSPSRHKHFEDFVSTYKLGKPHSIMMD